MSSDRLPEGLGPAGATIGRGASSRGRGRAGHQPLVRFSLGVSRGSARGRGPSFPAEDGIGQEPAREIRNMADLTPTDSNGP